MSSLPNVSSIYRDLSHIYSSTNYISKSQQTPNYSLQYPNYNNHNNQSIYGMNRNKNEKSAFQDMYDYKQKRHNELMARLKNSKEECQGLVGGFGYNIGVTDTGVRNNQYHDKYSTINNTNNIYPQNPIHYSSNNNPNQETRSKLTTFAIPKIRYRHIEDQKQKAINTSNNRHRQQNNGIVYNKQRQDTNQLQKQFYQDHNASNKPNPSSISNPNLNQNINKRTQKNSQTISKQKNSYPQQQFDTKSQLSYTNTVTNQIKNTKYQDKIQSYYQLCRKNINYKQNQVNSNMQKNSKQQKFVRSNNTGRNKVMKLDQAIKLLSLD